MVLFNDFKMAFPMIDEPKVKERWAVLSASDQLDSLIFMQWCMAFRIKAGRDARPLTYLDTRPWLNIGHVPAQQMRLKWQMARDGNDTPIAPTLAARQLNETSNV